MTEMVKLVTNSVGPACQSCQQRISSPTSVTNIDVAIFPRKTTGKTKREPSRLGTSANISVSNILRNQLKIRFRKFEF